MIRNRYNILLAVLVLHLGALALNLPRPWTDLANVAVAPIVALLLRTITGKQRTFWAMLVLASGGSILNLIFPWGSVPLALDLLKVAFWTLAPAYLALRVFVTIYDADDITHAEIAGAIAVYLLIALVFANVFETLYRLDPTCIHFGENFPAELVGFGEVLYFSLVTLSTLGYGDVSPASPLTRVFSVMESMTGLMYMAILVARFVSLHSSHRMARRRSQQPPD